MDRNLNQPLILLTCQLSGGDSQSIAASIFLHVVMKND